MPGRFVSTTAKVNVAGAATFYTRTGDWFAWLCVATLIVLLASRFLSRSCLKLKKAHAELKQATQRSTCLDYKSAAAEVVAAGDRKNSACRVVVTRLLDEGRACHAVIHVKARSRCRLARRAVDSWRWGRAEASAKADDYCVCASIFRAPVPTMMRVSTPMMHCCRPHAFCVPPQLCTSQAVEAAVSAPLSGSSSRLRLNKAGGVLY